MNHNLRCLNITRDKFVNALPEWFGVKFIDCGWHKTGCDCLGLVIGLLCNSDDQYKLGDLYQRQRNGNAINAVQIVQQFQCFYEKIAANNINLGDLIIFAIRGQSPMHVSIIISINPLLIMHAYRPAGAVIKNAIDCYWRKKILYYARLHFSDNVV